MPQANPYFWFILIAVVAELGLGRWVAWLNLRASRQAVPAELAGVYDDSEYRRSQAYTRARTRLGMVSSSVGLAGLLGFWLLGGFPWLDGVARELVASWGWLSGWRPVSTGLLFLGGLALGSSLLSLPYSVYSTFVLEERFGFNRTSVGTFVLDLLKGLLLSVALGAPLVAHEIGHFRRRHILKGAVLGVLHSGVVFFLLSVFLDQPGLYRAFGLDPAPGQAPVYAGLVFFGLLYAPVERVLSIGVNALSRRWEYQADRFAARATGRPGDLASAVTKLAADHLTNLTPHPVKVKLDHSHPPLRDRLAALR